MMDKVQNLLIPSDMHRRLNRLESSGLKMFENGAEKNICSYEEKVRRELKQHFTGRWVILIICTVQNILLG
jgi:hypothetical protein